MKFFKIFFVLFCFILGFFLIRNFFFPIGEVYVSVDNIKISTSCVTVPFEFLPYKDAIYKICFYFKGKKIIFPEYTLMSKKGKKYSGLHIIDMSNFSKSLPLLVKVKEIFPKEKIMTKKVLNIKQLEEISKLLYVKQKESSTVPASTEEIKKKEEVSVSSQTIVEKEKIQIVAEPKQQPALALYMTRKEAKKEKPNFEIYISTQEIKKEYFYNEPIMTSYTFVNKNS